MLATWDIVNAAKDAGSGMLAFAALAAVVVVCVWVSERRAAVRKSARRRRREWQSASFERARGVKR